MVRKYKEYLAEIGMVIKRPRYALLVIIIATIIVVGFAWLPNWRLVVKGMNTGNIKLLLGLAGSLTSNLHLVDLVILVISAVLSGIQITLLITHVRCKVQTNRMAGLSIIGTVVSLLGVGCSACGSILITSILGLSGVAILNKLPFGGMELGILGILVLLSSIGITGKKLSEAKSCVIGK